MSKRTPRITKLAFSAIYSSSVLIESGQAILTVQKGTQQVTISVNAQVST
ncbi:hypothetical protein [Lysinibacillus parviboronicapiens]|nr:hypothetical protein [Lysinibacillus parviboronicapiens]